MADKSLESYQASLNAASRGIWSAELDTLMGADAIYSAIRRGFEQAFTEGAAEYGIKASERTEAESKRLGELIGENFQYVARFVQWIYDHSRANGFKFETIRNRISEWVNRYEYVKTVGREMANADQKELWQRGQTEKGCCDCLRLAGRVYRNSQWQRYQLEPRSPKLNCGGYHCDCRRIPTDLPITKGKPPALRGPGGCGKGRKRKELDATLAE